MLLEYVWIDKFKVINNLGINFSTRFNIFCEKKDGKFYIKIEKKRINMPKEFFGSNISNITAIVGENGSGKSSILNYLLSELVYDTDNLHIYFCENENKIRYISKLDVIIENKTDIPMCELYDKIRVNQIPSITKIKIVMEAKQMIKQIKCNLEYSPLISKTNLVDKDGDFIPYIESDQEFNIFKKESFNICNSSMISNILRFISTNNILEILDIKLPDKIFLYIFMEKDNNILKSRNNLLSVGVMKGMDPFLNEVYKYYNRKLEMLNKKNSEYVYIYLFTYYLLELQVLSYVKDIEFDTEEYRQYIIFDNYKDVCTTLNTYIDKIIPLRKRIIERSPGNKSYTSSETLKGDAKKYLVILEGISQIKDSKIFYYGSPLRFEIELDYEKNSSEYLNMLIMMFSGKDYYNQQIYSIDWYGLSEGELNILKTLSKIYSFLISKMSYVNQVDTFLILIDEPDTSLHPELARRFIDVLVQVTNFIAKNTEIRIQYIITTHSPFIVSDLSKDNCVFLKKGNTHNIKIGEFDGQTFVANIHTLLQNAFFMKNTSGEFAIKNIKNLIEIVNEKKDEEHKEYVNYILNTIGEPVLKKTLEDFLKIKENEND